MNVQKQYHPAEVIRIGLTEGESLHAVSLFIFDASRISQGLLAGGFLRDAANPCNDP